MQETPANQIFPKILKKFLSMSPVYLLWVQ